MKKKKKGKALSLMAGKVSLRDTVVFVIQSSGKYRRISLLVTCGPGTVKHLHTTQCLSMITFALPFRPPASTNVLGFRVGAS